MSIRHYLMVLKLYYLRGYSYLGLGLGVLTILTFLKVYSDFLSRYLPGEMLQSVYIIIVVMVNIFCITGGYFDYHYGIWRIENNYAYIVTPKSEEMRQNCENIPIILEELKELRRQVEELKK